MIRYAGREDLIEADLDEGEQVRVLAFERPAQQEVGQRVQPRQRAHRTVRELLHERGIPVAAAGRQAVDRVGQRASAVAHGAKYTRRVDSGGYARGCCCV